MFEWLHIPMPPTPLLFAQLLVGLINGAFYAMLSLGLAVIFGLLNIINFTHGAQYMLGAFCAWFLLQWAGIGYWPALIIAPVAVGITGILIERVFLRQLAGLDHLYGLCWYFRAGADHRGRVPPGLRLVGPALHDPAGMLQGRAQSRLHVPAELSSLGYRRLARNCLATWYVIERTRLGAYLRAATENPTLVQAFGIDVPRMGDAGPMAPASRWRRLPG